MVSAFKISLLNFIRDVFNKKSKKLEGAFRISHKHIAKIL